MTSDIGMGRMSSVSQRLSLGLIALAALCCPASATECQLINRATFPVVAQADGVVVKGSLNDQDILVRFDTGLSVSMISGAAAQRVGLKPMQSTSRANIRFVGIGRSPTLQTVAVDRLKIADYAVDRKRWLVFPGQFGEDIDVVIGSDVLSEFDLEIALQERQVIIWHARNCEDRSLAYWSTEYMVANLRKELGPFGMNAEVDGRRLSATLASGTRQTVMTLGMARSLGFSPASDETADRYIYGINGQRSSAYEAGFREFRLGELTVANPQFTVANLHRYDYALENAYRGTPARGMRDITEWTTHVGEVGARFVGANPVFLDLVLGADFLRANRVLIANSQGKIYFTYAGGPVFRDRTMSVEGNSRDAGEKPPP